MNWQVADKLLEKYFSGLSTLEEERELKELFRRDDVPEHLKSYKELFSGIDQNSALSGPSDEMLDEWLGLDEEETAADRKSLRFWNGRLAIAAALALILATTFLFLNNSGMMNTYSQKEVNIAYDQTKKVLGYISAKMNTGMQSASPVGKLDEAGSSLDKFDLLNRKVDQTADQIKKFNTYSQKIKSPLNN